MELSLNGAYLNSFLNEAEFISSYLIVTYQKKKKIHAINTFVCGDITNVFVVII